jgi:mannose-6-phosphate isomerase
MIQTDKKAVIKCGNKNGETYESVSRALSDEKSKETMRDYTVEPGDAFLLYAGTMHYTDGGVIFYEIMQNSDVYIPLSFKNSSAKDEELEKLRKLSMEGVHIEEGYDCKTHPIVIEHGSHTQTYILSCEYFALERIDFDEDYSVSTDGSKFFVYTALKGTIKIESAISNLTLKPGQTCLIPATIGKVRFSTEENASLLRAYVPDLQKDVIKPLQAKGISDKTISRLGGLTRLNHLDRYLQRS